MSSSPSSGGVGDWGAQAPTDQQPLQSQNPGISYTGSFGQPSNNFQGMGKSPQVNKQPMGSNPMAQPQQQMQQPMQQQARQMPSRYDFNDRLGNESSLDMNFGMYRR